MAKIANMVDCENCGVSFNKKPFRVKRDNHHFCKVSCLYEYKRDNPMTEETRKLIGEKNRLIQYMKPQPTGEDSPRFNGIEVSCTYCNNVILKSDNKDSKIHFCNRDCYENYRQSIKYTKVNCACCGKEITKKTARIKNRPNSYCSETCQRKHFGEIYKGVDAPGWKGGISFEKYPREWRNSLKQLVRDRDNNTCQECGASSEERVLHVHHIDYDKKNNELINLITLCNRCHGKTNHNRDKWETYFKDFMEELICH